MMITSQSPALPWATLARRAVLAASLAVASAHVCAQTDPNETPPTENPPQEVPSFPSQPGVSEPAPVAPREEAGRNSSVRVLDEGRNLPLREAIGAGKRPLGSSGSVLTEAGTGAAVGEGSRVLKVPGACTPKTNSLDCVADASTAAQGANVSTRVRNSVIGEVGAGRGATEGAGGAKRDTACTPVAGQLTCQ